MTISRDSMFFDSNFLSISTSLAAAAFRYFPEIPPNISTSPNNLYALLSTIDRILTRGFHFPHSLVFAGYFLVVFYYMDWSLI